MPQLQFSSVAKSYGDTQVLEPFDASVDSGEFLVLLGPSGCGKSTLLRMIAGLTEITSGELLFDGETVNEWDVRKRDIAFVFQSYALYPQMTVRQNIAFPLVMDRMKPWQHLPILGSIIRSRLMHRPEIAGEVDRIAEQLSLVPYLDRRPGALSGGQRQRVALARSLVRDPSLYLLDEPLSNLDAKLRTQMRVDITALHQKVGKTFVYVTHDQIEAMTMATRIIVMDHGRIQQIGTPDEVYDNPANTFVATFVGSPAMNLISPDIVAAHPTAFEPGIAASGAIVGVRPEHLMLADEGAPGLPVTVEVVERTGAEAIIACQPQGQEGDESRILVRASHTQRRVMGEACVLQLDPAHVSLFDAATGVRVPQTSTVG
ncbi:ABC transporter ATP-binding protein [Demequina zhanjiangensis]|uniref:ABC transporter ATP-binding protein n=1 Tax=Demequina zhanjiangensis TaxID=3051659 RepID=A0ABT8FZB9_9MICO|nr:ABC transporter ATP-binding protein [Demequina sp. SYSU T00b26]MDN4472245.1 ABC transporter ATP-binding protein [Demequina sp. SYSU T00b26]